MKKWPLTASGHLRYADELTRGPGSSPERQSRLGAGTKPLHDLITNLQAAKYNKKDPRPLQKELNDPQAPGQGCKSGKVGRPPTSTGTATGSSRIHRPSPATPGGQAGQGITSSEGLPREHPRDQCRAIRRIFPGGRKLG